jgi:quercetin dioxygenase-like cupin family protein
MKIAIIALSAFIVALPALTVISQAADEQKIVQPQDVTWRPAPPALPPGAQAAVLLGDPSKEGLFAMRLKAPKGYSIAPHTHPKQEVVTVISGTVNLGMGEIADRTKTKALPVGTFYVTPAGMPHFLYFEDEAILQVNTIGPWGIKYVNPKDDPRQKTQ